MWKERGKVIRIWNGQEMEYVDLGGIIFLQCG